MGHSRHSPHGSSWVLVLLIAVLGAVFLAACGESGTSAAGPTGQASTPKPGGTYNYPLGANPISIVPLGLSESEGWAVAHQVFECLVKYEMASDGSTQTKPAIAESWTANADATEYTFKLRHGVTFQAPVSREVTARDFVACWNYVTDPRNRAAASYVLAPIEGCEDTGYQADPKKGLTGVSAPDDFTLVVKLRYPFAEFPTTVGHLVAAAWPVDYMQKVGKPVFRVKPVGTGPYLVERWRMNRDVDLVKNPDWWNTAAGGPYLDAIHFPIIPDVNAMWLEFQKGSIDFTVVPPGQTRSSAQMPEVKHGEWTAQEWPQLAIMTTGINSTDSVVGGSQNLELRQALSFGYARDAVINVVGQGTQAPATGVIPLGLPGAEGKQLPYPEDAAQAATLVQRLGAVPVIAHWDPIGGSAQKQDEALQAGWAEVGLKVKLEFFEWSTFLEKQHLPDGGSQLFGVGWAADYPSVDNFVYTFFHSSTSPMLGTFYSNAQVDDLLDRARRTVDDQARLDLYLQAEKIALADVAMIPAYSERAYRITNNRIANFVYPPMGCVDMWTLWVK